MRRIVPPLAAALTALALLAPGAFGVRAPTSADTQVRLVACNTTDRSLTVDGQMRSLAKGDVMQMRFTLQSHDSTSGAWSAVAGPGLDSWNKANAGIARYRFQKRIENLPAPGVYRVVVRYRWVMGHKVLAQTTRMTSRCVQPDPRPDLRVGKIGRGAGQLLVRVVNAGRGAAEAFDVVLSVNGTPVKTQTVPGLAAATPLDLHFAAPRCPSGGSLSIAVDTGNAIGETDETNNVKTVPCPS
jgi:hypothetical protein